MIRKVLFDINYFKDRVQFLASVKILFISFCCCFTYGIFRITFQSPTNKKICLWRIYLHLSTELALLLRIFSKNKNK